MRYSENFQGLFSCQTQELLVEDDGRTPLLGSSPLTRGTRGVGQVRELLPRFIPAYAGNSRAPQTSLIKETVHPRLRGELISILTDLIDVFGSSPLTRGTLFSSVIRVRSVRFIPAYAGNS